MLNRFKNALYGTTSNEIDEDDSALDRVNFNFREAALGKRIRSVIKRSASFQEYLTTTRNSNNLTNEYEYRNHSNSNHSGSASPLRRANSSTNRTALNKTRSIDDLKYDFVREPGVDYNACSKLPRYRYLRPDFLQLKHDDEILVSADHQIRPIILPRDTTKLPWKSGYAECINAGKSIRNEDQAACYQDVIFDKQLESRNEDLATMNENKLSWYYFGIFDGHAGSAVAVAASIQLHNIIGQKLNQISEILLSLEFDFKRISNIATDSSEDQQYTVSETEMNDSDKNNVKIDDDRKRDDQDEEQKTNQKDDQCDEQNNNYDIESSSSNETTTINAKDNENSSSDKRPCGEDDLVNKNLKSDNIKLDPKITMDNLLLLPSMIEICRNEITVDCLIKGILESSFWQMDAQIARDKNDYFMPGGCTAIVSLFIFGKLYVCNAGDSRAIVYKKEQVVPMSYDFTPISEKDRILRLGLQRPEFLRNEFTHLEFLRRPKRKDLGKQMLYKDAYMTGWSVKTITYDDLKFPLVWGEGKRSRVLATIGVTRGFGDHELKAQFGSVPIKPFLTPEPEVKILELESDEDLLQEDVLIMGSDGLWDVTTNEEAGEIVKESFNSLFPNSEESRFKYRYITAAQDLVIHSRGQTTSWNNIWRTDDKLASLDDIAVFVIPLKQYRDEYLEWKERYTKLRLKNHVMRQSDEIKQ